MNLQKNIREIILKCIKYQKIPCSCGIKDGVELTSIDQALSALTDLFLECVGKDKKMPAGELFMSRNSCKVKSFNQAKAEIREKLKGEDEEENEP